MLGISLGTLYSLYLNKKNKNILQIIIISELIISVYALFSNELMRYLFKQLTNIHGYEINFLLILVFLFSNFFASIILSLTLIIR
jgi:hypothetical protein